MPPQDQKYLSDKDREKIENFKDTFAPKPDIPEHLFLTGKVIMGCKTDKEDVMREHRQYMQKKEEAKRNYRHNMQQQQQVY